jgi:hypothetical protein
LYRVRSQPIASHEASRCDNSLSYRLFKKGRTSPPAASVNSEYVVPEKAILFNERGLLDPGERKAGRVNFDLAVPFEVDPSADLSGFRLRLDDGNPTEREEKYLELGF